MEKPPPNRRQLAQRTLLIVVSGLDRGGTERHLLQVLPRLREAALEPFVFSLSGKGPIGVELEAAGIEVITASGSRRAAGRRNAWRDSIALLSAATQLGRLLSRRRPDAVHFFLPAAYLAGGLASLLMGPRIRLMSRRSLNDYQSRTKVAAWMERRLHRHMTVLLGNSRAVVRQLLDEGAPREKVALIYNGMPLAVAPSVVDRAGARARLGISSGALVLVLVANLIPYKGHDDLIAALALIKGSLPTGWRALLIGRDTGIGPQLKQQADRLGLADNLIWLGERADVGDLLGLADIGLLCSHEEGFSNAILENMAAGLPVVVTNVGGNAEAVVDGQTGLVVPGHNPEKLSQAILALASAPDQRRAFGTAGRARVQSEFSLDQTVRSYIKLYNALLAGERPPIDLAANGLVTGKVRQT